MNREQTCDSQVCKAFEPHNSDERTVPRAPCPTLSVDFLHCLCSYKRMALSVGSACTETFSQGAVMVKANRFSQRPLLIQLFHPERPLHRESVGSCGWNFQLDSRGIIAPATISKRTADRVKGHGSRRSIPVVIAGMP
jgi:hypothetical protein